MEKIGRVYFTKDRTKVVMMGIIDYFQKYTWGKFFEKWTKKFVMMKL